MIRRMCRHIPTYRGDPTVRNTTLLDMPPEEQAQMLAALRRARYGYSAGAPYPLIMCRGRTPTEIAAFLFCSRSSVYRTCKPTGRGPWGSCAMPQGQLMPPQRPTGLTLALQHGARDPARHGAPGVWLVSHALELCHTGPDAAHPARGQRSPPRRCAAGSMPSAGCGNARS